MTPLRRAEGTTRVLHILNQLNPSGMERMLVSGAPYFEELDCYSFVLGQGKNHPYQADLVAAGYDVRIQEHTVRTLRGQRQLRRLIRSEKINVVHIHTEGNYLSTVVAAAWSLRGRGVIVRTIHSVFMPRGRVFLTRFAQALIADRFVKHLMAPSPDVAENERRFMRSPIVILNWVDDKFFEIARERSTRASSLTRSAIPIAVIVGNCSKVKRHELAISAVLHAGHKLIHIGSESGIEREEIDLLKKIEDRSNLMMRGAQAPEAALLAADYFLMSSQKEGMPVALAEALVVGLPCYITDVPGMRWAANVPFVTMLPEQHSAWNEALESYPHDTFKTTERKVEFDFSAKRGVGDYVETYRKQ